MTIAEANKIRDNQDYSLKKRVMNEGIKVGTKWNYDFLELDDVYELDGKAYQINSYCGIIDIKEV